MLDFITLMKEPMTQSPTLFQALLRRLVLRLVLMLDAGLGLRIAFLRLRLAMLPERHKRRRRLEQALARLLRVREILADPETYEDPGIPGLLAEIARVNNDAGRRALVRLYRWPTPPRPIPAPLPGPLVALAPGARCTTTPVPSAP